MRICLFLFLFFPLLVTGTKKPSLPLLSELSDIAVGVWDTCVSMVTDDESNVEEELGNSSISLTRGEVMKQIGFRGFLDPCVNTSQCELLGKCILGVCLPSLNVNGYLCKKNKHCISNFCNGTFCEEKRPPPRPKPRQMKVGVVVEGGNLNIGRTVIAYLNEYSKRLEILDEYNFEIEFSAGDIVPENVIYFLELMSSHDGLNFGHNPGKRKKERLEILEQLEKGHDNLMILVGRALEDGCVVMKQFDYGYIHRENQKVFSTLKRNNYVEILYHRDMNAKDDCFRKNEERPAFESFFKSLVVHHIAHSNYNESEEVRGLLKSCEEEVFSCDNIVKDCTALIDGNYEPKVEDPEEKVPELHEIQSQRYPLPCKKEGEACEEGEVCKRVHPTLDFSLCVPKSYDEEKEERIPLEGELIPEEEEEECLEEKPTICIEGGTNCKEGEVCGEISEVVTVSVCVDKNDFERMKEADKELRMVAERKKKAEKEEKKKKIEEEAKKIAEAEAKREQAAWKKDFEEKAKKEKAEWRKTIEEKAKEEQDKWEENAEEKARKEQDEWEKKPEGEAAKERAEWKENAEREQAEWEKKVEEEMKQKHEKQAEEDRQKWSNSLLEGFVKLGVVEEVSVLLDIDGKFSEIDLSGYLSVEVIGLENTKPVLFLSGVDRKSFKYVDEVYRSIFDKGSSTLELSPEKAFVDRKENKAITWSSRNKEDEDLLPLKVNCTTKKGPGRKWNVNVDFEVTNKSTKLYLLEFRIPIPMRRDVKVGFMEIGENEIQTDLSKRKSYFIWRVPSKEVRGSLEITVTGSRKSFLPVSVHFKALGNLSGLWVDRVLDISGKKVIPYRVENSLNIQKFQLSGK